MRSGCAMNKTAMPVKNTKFSFLYLLLKFVMSSIFTVSSYFFYVIY